MKLIFLFCVAYLIYHFYFGTNQNESSISAREIEPRCDVVLFTTASCPYCKMARDLLIVQGAKWCEKNVETSSVNQALFKDLGGRGVPLALIGNELIDGFREDIYIAALASVEPSY